MNSYTVKLTSQQAEKIKTFFGTLDVSFDTIQYANWRAKSSSFQATYYNSCKFLVQGKDVSGIVKEIERIVGISSTTGKQQSMINVPNDNIIDAEIYIGTDESGKGDFFGPLVVAGVQVTPANKEKFIELGIKDSKKLNDSTIKKLAAFIRNNSVHSVVVMTPKKYNELYSKFKNLNKLLAWGHARAIENILEKSPCTYALSDKFGDERLIQNALMKNGREIKLDQRVRAESDIAVAAASIIARAEFVKRMDELALKYGIDFPKGASDKVVQKGKDFVKKYTVNDLNEVAKLHFKTTIEVSK